jgi:hypothetical protein
MSRLQSSDFAPSIACLEDAWSELSQPSAADKDAPSILPNISSPQVSIPLADEVASSISLHQNPNCSTSTYRYYGETEDDVPHGVGIRIYTNSGSIEKGQFFHGVFQSLGEFTCADYGETPPSSLHVAHHLLQYTAVHFSGEWLTDSAFGSGCIFRLARTYRESY